MTGAVLLALRVLMALVIYAFLAFAVYQFWRELKRQAQGLSSPALPRLSLMEISSGEEAPRRFQLAEPVVTVGRDPTCEVALDDPTISARHTRLSYHHGQWWVEDLQSTNGTFLNSQPVSVAVVLASGDEMRCGALGFLVGIEEEAV